MTWVAIGVAAVGAVVSISGQQKAKKAAKEDAAFQAEQLRQRAAVSRAAGQRSAEEQRRQSRLIESAIQARAGGGGMDPTVVKLMADVAGEGEYRALSALYEGETGAFGDEARAAAAMRTGRAQADSANYQMAGTALSAASSMYTKYSGPKSGT